MEKRIAVLLAASMMLQNSMVLAETEPVSEEVIIEEGSAEEAEPLTEETLLEETNPDDTVPVVEESIEENEADGSNMDLNSENSSDVFDDGSGDSSASVSDGSEEGDTTDTNQGENSEPSVPEEPDTELCAHHPKHTEQCGYDAANAESVCGFQCPVCHEERYPFLADSDVGITVASENAKAVNGKVDLLEGVIAADPDGSSYEVRIYSVISDKDQLPAALEDGRFLTSEAQVNYCLVYAAYDSENHMVAALERKLNAENIVEDNIEADEEEMIAEAGIPETCAHHPIHTAQCGYVEGDDQAVCGFQCPICHKELFPNMNGSGIAILLPGEEANLVSGKVDLLDGVSLEGDGSNNCKIKVYSIINKEDSLPAELEEEHFLETKAGSSYLMIYGAYNADGALVAAEQRELTAAEPETAGDEYVAYDAENEADANVKVTVTLPEGVKVLDGYRLYVRKEEDRVTREMVEAEIGEVNVDEKTNQAGIQCYDIHWIDQDGNPGESIFAEGTDVTAKVKVEYLKEEARLLGSAASRKLMILNLQSDDSLKMETSVTDLQVNEKGYTGFTFNTKDKGPFVFASKKVFEGYISSLSFASVVDETAPWDKTGNLVEGTATEDSPGTVDVPGNDSGPSNGVVRSYDRILYDIKAFFSAREAKITCNQAKMYFELSLFKGLTDAQFDTKQMLWLGENYIIEYYDENGDVQLIKKPDGKFYLPDGKTVTTINKLVNGSEHGSGSYKVAGGRNSIVEQKITGWKMLTGTEENPNVLSGNQSFSAAIQIRNVMNGEVFAPDFRFWLEGNEDNYGPEDADGVGQVQPAKKFKNTITAEPIVTSAGARYNMQLKKANDISYKSWFDFSTGDEIKDKTVIQRLEALSKETANVGIADPSKWEGITEEEKVSFANYRYGRITGYGITLQLCNDTDNNPDSNRAEKGFKGYALPVDEITFDLNFTSTAGNDKENYTPILWDYNENFPSDWGNKPITYEDPFIGSNGVYTRPGEKNKGHWNRNLFWNYEDRTTKAKGAAPSNYKVYHSGCYYGGDWSITSKVSNPQDVTGNGESTLYSFEVKGYDFDFDTQHFPSQDAGNSGDISEYTTYAACFSAGYIQLLNVFPRVQKESVVDLNVEATVNNLSVTTRAGLNLSADPDDSTKIGHEVIKKDNKCKDKIDLYAPGGAAKGNSFNKREAQAQGDKYLGTDYWGTAYDCSAFAGEEISILGFGLINANSDYRLRAMNLLQLFDSRGLKMDGTPKAYLTGIPDVTTEEDKGEATFLYAADPLWPDGYDTNGENGSEVMRHMNLVREEDLVYSDKLDEDGEHITVDIGGVPTKLRCIGVLMELRKCNLPAGKYQHMNVPVKVNSEDVDLVSKTVATVNVVRMWCDENAMTENGASISWVNGSWNPETKKNELAGYQDIKTMWTDGTGNGYEVANKIEQGYVKAEFLDGEFDKATHKGGVLYGNSLMILNYKAGVKINTNKQIHGSGNATYDMNQGENQVRYILRNIETKVEKSSGAGERKKTDLTIKAVLDGGKRKAGDRRIMVTLGSYKMKGYEVDDEGNLIGEEQDIAISTNSEAPTKIGYYGSDGQFYVFEIYAVQDIANQQRVQFELKGVPVGIYLPEITFDAGLINGRALNNNDNITTEAFISGTGDCRAYDKTQGNQDNVTIGIIKNTGSFISKSINRTLLELDDLFTYTVSYSNSSSEVIKELYLYDLVPEDEDERQSKFHGSLTIWDFKAGLYDDSVAGDDTGEDAGEDAGDGTGGDAGKDSGGYAEGEDKFNADVTIYYSTVEYHTLKPKIEGFNGKSEAAIKEMLEKSGLFQVLGTIDKKDGSFVSELTGKTSEEIKNIMEQITCIYIKVLGLGGNRTISFDMTLQAKGNGAGDMYGNVAYSWDTSSREAKMASNLIQANAVSRDISGVAWYDKNANGIRDAKEPLLDGVMATLFKKNQQGTYEICTEDVTRSPIGDVAGKGRSAGTGTILTDANGAYSFAKLPYGDYLVAFSGDKLEEYTGAAQYQKGGSSAVSNDGVKASDLGIPGFDGTGYAYAIKYSQEAANMTLHTPQEMVSNDKIALENSQERIKNQDLGLVKTGDLKITKTVNPDQNGQRDTARTFNFEVEITVDDEPITGEYGGYTFDEAGKTMVSLKHGDAVTIKNLPGDAHYKVTEQTNDYDPKQAVFEGELEKDQTITASFENDPPAPVTASIKAQKTVIGEGAPDISDLNGKFGFTLARAAGEPADTPMPANTAASNDGTGAVNFGDITFTKSGEYHYVITENAINDSRWEKDNAAIAVTVNVRNELNETTKKHALKAEVSYSGAGADGHTFTNTYKKPAGTAALTITKTLTNKEAGKFTPALVEGQFSFLLQDAGGQNVGTAENAADGNVSFTDIVIPSEDFKTATEKTYVYTICEVLPKADDKDAAIEYDTAVIQAAFKVTLGNDNVLHQGDVTYTRVKGGTSSSGSALENKWQSPSEIQVALEAKKELTNGTLEADDFQFTLTPGAAENAEGLTTAPGTEQTVSNNAGGSISFPEITFDREGIYHYTIKEKVPNPQNPSIDYDTREIRAKVTVTRDKSTNVLTSSVEYEGGVDGTNTIRNTYRDPGKASAAFEVKKQVQDEAGAAMNIQGTYTFELLNDQNQVIDTAVAATGASGGMSAKAQFKAISWDDTELGEHVYKIREKNGGNPKIGYSTDTVTVRVNVTKDAKNELHAEVTYDGKNEIPTFVNTYQKPADATVNLKVTKLLDLPEGTADDEVPDKTFTFTLEPVDGAPMPTDKEVTVVGAGEVSFGPITFEAEKTDAVLGDKTYRYTIKEKPAGNAGITYDSGVITAAVTVGMAKDGSNKLEVRGPVEYSKPQKGEETDDQFVNTYTKPAPVTVDAAVKKNLTGDRTNAAAGEFTFSLKPENGAPMPEGTDGKPVSELRATTAAEGIASFGTLTFTEDPGTGTLTYTYKIEEAAGTNPSVTYNTTPVTMTVTVTKNADNKLLASVAYDGKSAQAAEITNHYTKPDPAVFALEATKKLTEKDPQGGDTEKALEEGQFSFTMTPVGDAPMPKDNQGIPMTSVTVSNGADGSVRFPNITVEEKTDAFLGQGGAAQYVYQYELKEVNGGDPSYTYDSQRTVTATVTITKEAKTDPNGGSKLVAAVTYDGNGNVFQNVYKEPDDVAEAFQAQKHVVKADGTEMEVKNIYTFVLKDKDDKILQETKSDSDGKVIFAPITWTSEDDGKVYDYKIEEVKGSHPGMTYDPEPIQVQVKVAKNQKNQMEAEITYKKNGKEVTAPEILGFENTYQKPKEAETTLEVTKLLTGKDLTAGEFTFTLEGKDGAPLPEKAEVTNDKDGKVSFGPIIFAGEETDADLKDVTYEYTIRESSDKDASYHYDSGVITAKVTVGMKADGSNELEVKGPVEYSKSVKADETDDQFVNTYTKPVQTKVPVSLKKNLTGGRTEVRENEFSFVLTPVKDAPMPSDGEGNSLKELKASVKADGSAFFGELVFTEDPGKGKLTYQYEITEEAGGNPSVTYDDQKVLMTVEITKNGDNELVPGVSYEKAGKEADSIQFNNQYQWPTEAVFRLEAEKKLAGAALAAEQFAFVMTPVDNAPMPVDENGAPLSSATAKNDGKGKIVFPEIAVREDQDHYLGAEGEEQFVYQYELKEVKGNDTSYVYDGQTVIATVTVIKNENNQLEVASIAYTDTRVSEENQEETGKEASKEETETAKNVFYNTYTAPDSVTLQLEGTKILKGADLKAGQFFFTLKPKNGAPGKAQTVTNNGTGRFVFDAVIIRADEYPDSNARMTYSYEIAEKKGTAKGYTYDEEKVTVNVTVKKTGADGKSKLEIEKIEYLKAGSSVNSIQFVNTYKEEEKEEPDASVTPIPKGGSSYNLPSGSGSVPSGSGSVRSVKTGDETPVAEWLILLFVSLAAAGTVYWTKRKKNAK